jgi:hypothetical protein
MTGIMKVPTERDASKRESSFITCLDARFEQSTAI